MKKERNGLKIFIFILVATVVFGGISYVFRPFWYEWQENYTKEGFYKDPENTIQTLILGSSVAETSISPMELYEDYGICAYNAASQSQPLMGSYYLAEEAYRLHEDTLDTIVLDVSMMRGGAKNGMYVKIADTMEFSAIKLRFLKDFSQNITEIVSHLIPVLYYHDNWKSITSEDFIKGSYGVMTYSRGYSFLTGQYLNSVSDYSQIFSPLYCLQDDTEAELDEEALEYLERLIEFCEIHEIRLILIKTPQENWYDGMHNAVQAIADENQLEFLDFNYLPLIDEIEFNAATDTTDGWHMNYYSAVNLTDWIGNYLVEECENRDIREEEQYAFMEEELLDYHRRLAMINWNEITDPAEYLATVMADGDYIVFIAAQDDASASLTEEQRDRFAALGLEKLSELSFREPYLAIIDGDKITESSSEQEAALYEQGALQNEAEYSLISGGYEAELAASIIINNTEYSLQNRGLNIAVYDKQLMTVVDASAFDTNASSARMVVYYKEALEEALQKEQSDELTGKLEELYQYDQVCEDTKVKRMTGQKAGKD